MDKHDEAVAAIAGKIEEFHRQGQKFRISHGSTNSTRHPSTKGSQTVDISHLNHVLHVDKSKKTTLVEPNVSMDRLVEATLPYGLIPPVVMEFPGITVGGGYAGTSGESSSFKHGYFDRTILRVEMILGNGEVINCSPQEKSDLFHGAAGAVGSLGVTTLIKLQLRKATKYVEVLYHPVPSVKRAIEKIMDMTTDPDLDYVDGIIFSKDHAAIITGRLTDEFPAEGPVQCFSAPSDPWFYLHVQEKTCKADLPVKEVVPLAEYLFRYDRGGFWVGVSAFDYFKVPFNRITRWFLDDFLHTRMMYTALHARGLMRGQVVQDLALPYSTAQSFIEYTEETFGIYPLWLCPLKQSPRPTIHPHLRSTTKKGENSEQMLNIGLWGQGPWNIEEFVKLNRNLEVKLEELGGMKWLYAATYYSKEDFWKMFDKRWYDGLRDKYHANSLPDVYEKVRVETEVTGSGWSLGSLLNMWPFNGLYGIKKAIESGSYIQARAATWRTRQGSTGIQALKEQ